MRVVKTISELKSLISGYKQENKTVGLVPTMGALHAGRPVDFTALAKLALAHSDGVIIHTETVAQELLDFIEENKIPCLPYEGSFDVDKYAEFYKTL